MKKKQADIKLFWTSGWDSTFRLIQVLMTTDLTIEPHFIIRTEHSTGIEIDAQIKIRRLISRKYPEVISRLFPTVYMNADLITSYEDVFDEIESMRQTGRHINIQYDLLACYCRQFNIEKIEVGIIQELGGDSEKWLDDHLRGVEAFNCFTYPIALVTKKDIDEITKKNGWDDIMALTSFCRRPKFNIRPCGACGPCFDTVKDGLSHRLPMKSRLKAKIQAPFRLFWRKYYYQNQNNWFFKSSKKALEKWF